MVRARLIDARSVAGFVLLAGLAACSNSATAPVDQHVEATQYLARAAHDYTPPGPPDDPWGPYIAESSKRFDVPERWVREVMRVESGGRQYLNGVLITSPVGAMGLMQVMPSTFDEVSARDDIPDNPYDPRNNILAGTAYLREMYDVYGSPGFLAAYDAGPRRLDDYLSGAKPLPDETRHYVAMIGPYIRDSFPANRSEADLMAVNEIPIDIPPGTRFGDAAPTRFAESGGRARPAPHALYARAEHEQRGAGRDRGRPVQLARATHETRDAMPLPPVEVAEYAPPHAHGPGYHVFSAAMADPMPSRHGGRTTIQEASFSRPEMTRGATAAHGRAATRLSAAESHASESRGPESRAIAAHSPVREAGARHEVRASPSHAAPSPSHTSSHAKKRR